MSKGYSFDLRSRVIGCLEREGLTLAEAAERFSVGVATVNRWKRLKRETGSLEPRPHGGGRPRLLSAAEEQLVNEMVSAHPDWTEDEYKVEFFKLHGVDASAATIGRVIRRLGYSVKKDLARHRAR